MYTPEQFNLTEEEVKELAPSDLEWHVLYQKTMLTFYPALEVLINHPGFKDAEDLGDYVEALQTMIGFRPSTHPHIVEAVRDGRV